MTTTRYFRWDDSGAPTLSGQAGSFKALMKALLVGSGGVAYGSGGTAKAAAGWTNAFPSEETSTKIALRNSLAAGGLGCYLRIDDSNAQYAIITMYESMSDIDTGSGATDVRYVPKSTASSSAARAWVVVADEITIWGGVHINSASPSIGDQQYMMAFGGGNLDNFVPGDPSCFIAGNLANTTTSSMVCGVFANSFSVSNNGSTEIQVTRNNAGSASTATMGLNSLRPNNNQSTVNAIGGNALSITTPAPALGGHVAIEAIGCVVGTPRFRVRGLYIPLTRMDNTTTLGTEMTPVGQPPGSLMVVLGGQTQSSASANTTGRMLIETALSWD